MARRNDHTHTHTHAHDHKRQCNHTNTTTDARRAQFSTKPIPHAERSPSRAGGKGAKVRLGSSAGQGLLVRLLGPPGASWDSLEPPETFWGLLGPPGPSPGASWGFLGSPGASCGFLSSGDLRPAAHSSARGPGPGPVQHAPQRSTHGQLTVNTTVNTRSTQRSTSLKINEFLRAC